MKSPGYHKLFNTIKFNTMVNSQFQYNTLYNKKTNSFENKGYQRERCFSNLLFEPLNEDAIYDNGCLTTSEPLSRRLMTAFFYSFF